MEPVDPTPADATARAWFRRSLAWEHRLTELRAAHAGTPRLVPRAPASPLRRRVA